MRLTLEWMPIALLAMAMSVTSCDETEPIDEPTISAVEATFGSRLDLENLPDYEGQQVPNYVTKDNLTGSLDNEIVTLGRVLFYDKELSIDRTVSCASCHRQELGFTDDAAVSLGVNGVTGRHSMRLVNARFGNETRFFWDERANTLEEQTTMPIQDHAEMGFSGANGDPDLNDLMDRLQDLGYYKELFAVAYGDSTITEPRMQTALSQFIRSIQSFDSKYDAGRGLVAADNQPFPNFTQEENNGKTLFLAPPQFNPTGVRIGGGLGCAGCHQPPEFDIAPNSLNNGVITQANDPNGTDGTNTRAPSLRDMFDADGNLHSPLMHTGSFMSMQQVLMHYNMMTLNPNLDNRLRPGGNPQRLNMTNTERDAVIAFLQTLTGQEVYTAERYASPFE